MRKVWELFGKPSETLCPAHDAEQAVPFWIISSVGNRSGLVSMQDECTSAVTTDMEERFCQKVRQLSMWTEPMQCLATCI
jgi:hypothetical protein